MNLMQYKLGFIDARPLNRPPLVVLLNSRHRVGLIGELLSPQGLTKLLSLQLVMEHLEAPFVALGLQRSDSIVWCKAGLNKA
jgi:hypothetical protein